MALQEFPLPASASVTSGQIYSVATASGKIGIPTVCQTSTTLSAWAAGLGSGVGQIMNIDMASRRSGFAPTYLDLFD